MNINMNSINIEKFGVSEDDYQKLFNIVFKLLNCHSLWIMQIVNDSLKILATDKIILEEYWCKQYYLDDPVLAHGRIKDSSNQVDCRIDLGTDCVSFQESGFLYDLYKLFRVEEFVSIEKSMGLERYCFRFFTKSNRFVFMNKVVNDMPIIKHFIKHMISKCKKDLFLHPSISLTELRQGV